MKFLKFALLTIIVGLSSGFTDRSPALIGKWQAVGPDYAFIFMEDGRMQTLQGGVLQPGKQGSWTTSNDNPPEGFIGVIEVVPDASSNMGSITCAYKLESQSLTLALCEGVKAPPRTEVLKFTLADAKPKAALDGSPILGSWRGRDDETLLLQFGKYGDASISGGPDDAHWQLISPGKVRISYPAVGGTVENECSVRLNSEYLTLNPAECFGMSGTLDKDTAFWQYSAQ